MDTNNRLLSSVILVCITISYPPGAEFLSDSSYLLPGVLSSIGLSLIQEHIFNCNSPKLYHEVHNNEITYYHQIFQFVIIIVYQIFVPQTLYYIWFDVNNPVDIGPLYRWVSIHIALSCIITAQQNYEHKKKLQVNRSIGAFYALGAFRSYFESVFQTLPDRINHFESKYKVTLAVRKLVLLLPLSCETHKSLEHINSNIKYISNLETIECDQGANINREYKNPVYKLSISNYQDVYIPVEYPNSLLVLFKMKKDHCREYWEYQRDSFIETLKDLLKNSPCIFLANDMVSNTEELHSYLYSEIKQHMIGDNF